MNNFREISIWNKAVELATVIYKTTDFYPKNERYGLISQIRRCTVSISSNIAEEAGRRLKKEFRRFLNIATGSCYELETQLLISKNLDYINKNQFKILMDYLIEIQKMVYVLIKSLK